ncbi:MAG TPA: response regulator [Verrucomicrobiae bacterium]|nr:response regulator [Verrucomicrobiae bacterium]
MKKVLIIDGDPIVAQLYRSSLEKQGYAAETCNDGQTGLERAQACQPDAILLELMLAKLNGIELLKRLRALNGSLPLLVLTNAYLPDMIQEATAAGAARVFDKSNTTPKNIIDVLDQLLQVVRNVAPPHPPPTRPPPQVAMEHPGSPPPPANYGYNADNRGSASPPGPSTDAAPTVEADNSAFEEVRKAFVETNAQSLAELRKLVQGVMQTPDAAAREPLLMDLYCKIYALAGNSALIGFAQIAQMASLMEGLIKEMVEKQQTMNDASLRTVACCIDFIGELSRVSQPSSDKPQRATILIVDEDAVSRRAIADGLTQMQLNSEVAEAGDAAIALELAAKTGFNLIFLEVQMPEINGFDLCKKIKALPWNQSTPIIFVSRLADFKTRAKSTLSGGSDLIAKPFLLRELGLKAMMVLLRHRLAPARKAA